MPANPSLSSLPQNGYVEGVYSLINPQLGTTRTGKPYLKCILRDASGEVVTRQWSFDEGRLGAIQTTGFVSIAGHTQVYNGQVQLILEHIDAVEVTDEQLATLLPTTNKNIDAMYGELKKLLGSLEHPAMAALARVFLEDEELMSRFRRAPAAASIHHAWIGGLLEHTLQLLKLADVMLPLYPGLNRDLILMGLFLHDIGKTSELTWERGFEYTPDGNLIGHVVRGAIWLQFKSALAAKQSGQRLPIEAFRALQHIILSHHGVPEFGAAKVPSTPEAVFVSMLDNLDAKTQIALTAADRESTEQAGDFSDKIWALNTRIYRPDPLKPGAARPAAKPRTGSSSSRPKRRRGGGGDRRAKGDPKGEPKGDPKPEPKGEPKPDAGATPPAKKPQPTPESGPAAEPAAERTSPAAVAATEAKAPSAPTAPAPSETPPAAPASGDTPPSAATGAESKTLFETKPGSSENPAGTGDDAGETPSGD